MFIKIDNKEDLINTITNYIEKDIIIHYYCKFCKENQSSNAINFNGIIFKIQKKEYIDVMLDCTKCGKYIKAININNIHGLEIF